jgi:hypothetical protein
MARPTRPAQQGGRHTVLRPTPRGTTWDLSPYLWDVLCQYDAGMVFYHATSQSGSLLVVAITNTKLHYAHCPILSYKGEYGSGDWTTETPLRFDLRGKKD